MGFFRTPWCWRNHFRRNQQEVYFSLEPAGAVVQIWGFFSIFKLINIGTEDEKTSQTSTFIFPFQLHFNRSLSFQLRDRILCPHPEHQRPHKVKVIMASCCLQLKSSVHLSGTARVCHSRARAATSREHFTERFCGSEKRKLRKETSLCSCKKVS